MLSQTTSKSHGVHDRQKKKNDIILISVALVLAALAGLAMLIFRAEGNTVIVSVDGEVFAEYSLTQNREVEIKNGDGYNVLVIEDGSAYIRSASCPDGICASHRPISHNRASIVCLPNKVIVEIRTTEQDAPDIIN